MSAPSREEIEYERHRELMDNMRSIVEAMTEISSAINVAIIAIRAAYAAPIAPVEASAAPELYEALRRIADYDWPDGFSRNTLGDIARAALAKVQQ